MEFLRRRRTEAAGEPWSVPDRDRPPLPLPSTATGPIAGLVHGRPPASSDASPASSTASGDSAIDRLRHGRDAQAHVRGSETQRPTGPAAVIRRIPAGITKERTVRVLKGDYAGAVGTLYNWYQSTGKYEVGFDAVPSPTLRDLEYFLPDELEFADANETTKPAVSTKQEIDDFPSPDSSSEDVPTKGSGRYQDKQWLILIRDVKGMKKGTRFQVLESIDTEQRVEVIDDTNHPYGGSYGYGDVEPAKDVSPGTVASLQPPQDPASLPALKEGKDGNRPFREHPDATSMEAALKSHGFTIEFNAHTTDQHTQVIRYQEPGRSAVGKRVVEIGPTTTYSDVEHEFTHVRQQTRWSKTPGVGYLPTKTEQVTAGTLAEGRANADDREMDDFVERSLGEVEAYGEELIRLDGRGELRTGELSLPELAKDRFLRWLGDYIGLVNGDPGKAKENFTLANEAHRKLFPDVESTVRSALLIVGKLLGKEFAVPKSVIDRRG